MQWLLDRKADGKPWTERNSEIEGEAPNGWRDGVRQAVQTLDHAGVQPSFVSDDMAAGGALRLRGVRMLILPDAIALSPQAAKAIAAFAAGGGVVLADKEAGLFDLHGRRQVKSLLAGAALTRVADFSSGAVAAGLREAHVSPGFALADAGTGAEFTDVEARRFQTGKVTILALLRDFSAGRAALQAENGVLSVGSDRHIYVLGQGPAGSDVSLKVTLSSTVPAIFVISPTALPGPVLRVPQSVTRGSGSKVAVALTAPSPAADDAVEVTIADPAGRMVGDGPETILLHDGEGAWTMRIGKNGPVGVWTLRAKEMLGGQTTTEHVRVN
jgi:hypothetical protein